MALINVFFHPVVVHWLIEQEVVYIVIPSLVVTASLTILSANLLRCIFWLNGCIRKYLKNSYSRARLVSVYIDEWDDDGDPLFPLIFCDCELWIEIEAGRKRNRIIFTYYYSRETINGKICATSMEISFSLRSCHGDRVDCHVSQVCANAYESCSFMF